jgi:hypothetical protein
MAKLASASVLAAIIVSGLVACGGGGHGTSDATRGDGATLKGGPPANPPGRLDEFSAALQARGYRVGDTSPRPGDTPRSLWPEAGLRVLTDDGPVNIYAYRSERTVKASINPAHVPTLLARDGVDQIGGCGRYVYFGTRRATDSRALDRVVRSARVCPHHGVGFIVVQ